MSGAVDQEQEAEVDTARPGPRGWRRYAVEALIGVVLALILIYVAWASSGEVPFVYEGY